MNPILKFIGLCLVFYTAFMMLFKLDGIESGMNKGFRNTVEWILKKTFPEAFIETQDFKDASNRIDPNSFYLVYGNPSVIQAEKDYATQNQLSEYKISTFSLQFFIFQIFVVPFIFLISIFLASPMPWRSKLIYLSIASLILILVMIAKLILLTQFSIANNQIGIYELSDSSLKLVFYIVSAMTLGFSIMLVFCLWLILGFRQSAFNNLFSNFINQFKNEN